MKVRPEVAETRGTMIGEGRGWGLKGSGWLLRRKRAGDDDFFFKVGSADGNGVGHRRNALAFGRGGTQGELPYAQ